LNSAYFVWNGRRGRKYEHQISSIYLRSITNLRDRRHWEKPVREKKKVSKKNTSEKTFSHGPSMGWMDAAHRTGQVQ
jgi:hypothetical protein